MTEKSVQLQVQFTNYEISFILQHLQSHIDRVQRHNPHLSFECPTLRKNHSLIQFTSRPNLQVPAYELYTLNIDMIQNFHPTTRVYFTGRLSNAKKTFPQCYNLNNHSLQPTEADFPILPLLTRDGAFHLPSISRPEDAKAFSLYSLCLHLRMEQLVYALPQFIV